MRIITISKSIIFFCVLSFSCRKPYESLNTSFVSRNYVTINGETKRVGYFPNLGNYIQFNGQSSNPDQWYLMIYFDTDFNGILGFNDCSLGMYFNMWDKDLLKDKYDISEINRNINKTAVVVEFEVRSLNGPPTFLQSSAISGTLNITKDAQGKLKSVEFKNVKFDSINGKSIVISCYLEVN